MEIIKFDQMAAQDRQDFIDLLPNAAETVLEQEGRRADALKLFHLFNDISSGSDLSLGFAELEMNLANQRVRDVDKHNQNPDAPRIQVETALALTLNAHDIKITPDFVRSFMQLTGKFKPKLPPLDMKNKTRGETMSTNVRIGYAATAMEIQRFDKMADQDQAEYVADLVEGAEKVLKDEGRHDLSEKVTHLFTTKEPGADFSIGMAEFYRNLAILRLDDVKNHAKHPNDPRLEVEDALYATLDKNGIHLPASFYTVAKGFKPKHPLQRDPTDTPAPPKQRDQAAAEAATPAHTGPATTQPPVTPATTNAAPASAPAPKQNMTPDDDPIGEGGFITPYSPKK